MKASLITQIMQLLCTAVHVNNNYLIFLPHFHSFAFFFFLFGIPPWQDGMPRNIRRMNETPKNIRVHTVHELLYTEMLKSGTISLASDISLCLSDFLQ